MALKLNGNLEEFLLEDKKLLGFSLYIFKV